ncbi:hypothetical protein Are01nite_31990 [Actinoplanes regularis]|nr:hypothetical protein Are01nite_31990 [Actinoplanes regularis]
MRLGGRGEVRDRAEVDLPAAGAEPTAAASRQDRRFHHFGHPEDTAVERSRDRLAARRDQELDMVKIINTEGHDHNLTVRAYCFLLTQKLSYVCSIVG